MWVSNVLLTSVFATIALQGSARPAVTTASRPDSAWIAMMQILHLPA
jgi:hypothetical protein